MPAVAVRIFHFDDGGRIQAAALAGRRIRVRGTVQGVGFRPWVYRVARASAVTGSVRNDTAAPCRSRLARRPARGAGCPASYR